MEHQKIVEYHHSSKMIQNDREGYSTHCDTDINNTV